MFIITNIKMLFQINSIKIVILIMYGYLTLKILSLGVNNYKYYYNYFIFILFNIISFIKSFTIYFFIVENEWFDTCC